MTNRQTAAAVTITSGALMAFGALMAAPKAVAGCMPSDPRHNRFNICPEGFASLTQNFNHLNHVRGELQIGDPIQPVFQAAPLRRSTGSTEACK